MNRSALVGAAALLLRVLPSDSPWAVAFDRTLNCHEPARIRITVMAARGTTVFHVSVTKPSP